MNLLSKALDRAISQIEVMEDPPGSNAGYSVEVYLKSVGLGKGHAWCAAFLYWAFNKAATDLEVKNPLIKTAGVLDHWQRAKPVYKITAAQARKDPSLIKPGVIGILLLDKRTGAGHTFIVEKAGNNLLTTIEGNTAPMNSASAGSREGIGVFRLYKRKLSDASLIGFLDYSR